MINPVINKGTLLSAPAPHDLAHAVLGFVWRDEAVSGGVVRVLPELRASIQFMTADHYWLKDRAEDARWRRLPRAALWGPRFEWAYGYAARRVTAFAIGFSPSWLHALSGVTAAECAGVVMDLYDRNTALAVALVPQADEPFEAWVGRASSALRSVFAAAPPQQHLRDSLHVLATSDGGAIARAAKAAQLSERQFRRVFEKLYGAPPKRYQRALRVDRMLRQLHPTPWEADALHGEPIPFADQPHAIREFRDMVGLTPSAYAAQKRHGDRTLRSVPADGVAPPNDDGDAARY